jgi:hypothetical protein
MDIDFIQKQSANRVLYALSRLLTSGGPLELANVVSAFDIPELRDKFIESLNKKWPELSSGDPLAPM